MTFKALESKKTWKGREFDKNIKFTLGGVEQRIYAYTQAGREDTELYPTMEKYGIDIGTAAQKCGRTMLELYGDATQMADLRATEDGRIQREKIWNQIPLKIRNQFGNNPDEFIRHGAEWAQKEMEKQIKTTQPAAAVQNETKGEQ